MRRSDKIWSELDEPSSPFLPDEAAGESNAAAVEVRERLAKLEQQVLAQYTATAAYATIAQQNVDHVRAEARADLDRAQAITIGLIEKLRGELHGRLDGSQMHHAGGAAAPSDGGAALAALQDKLAQLTATLESVQRENREMRNQLTAVTNQLMAEDGWLVSNNGTNELSLR